MDRYDMIAAMIVAFIGAIILIVILLLTCYGLAMALSLDYSDLLSSTTTAYLFFQVYKYCFKLLKEQ